METIHKEGNNLSSETNAIVE